MDTIICKSVEETIQKGSEVIAPRLQPGAVLALTGDLGAGKTHFVKGIAFGLGYSGEVTSPTFTLLHEYAGGRLSLYHLDLYRIEGAQEAIRFGIEDYLPSDGVTIIEWPERVETILPATTEWWRIRILEDQSRQIERTR
ncbi:MAG: tRNA (adenosine(37)-N6)-threonylcarbamoyltransferase complex ATPase subunit type 1 TsaE [Verrucomicrobiota bacterium]